MWEWVPAKGHSRGILLGVKDDILEIKEWVKGEFFIEVRVRDRLKNVRWRMVVVYGPANHNFSGDFLAKLDRCCKESILPIIMEGDFNLTRDRKDKSSQQGDERLTGMFNSFIENNSLRKI